MTQALLQVSFCVLSQKKDLHALDELCLLFHLSHLRLLLEFKMLLSDLNPIIHLGCDW